jgi:hypothetical protein
MKVVAQDPSLSQAWIWLSSAIKQKKELEALSA